MLVAEPIWSDEYQSSVSRVPELSTLLYNEARPGGAQQEPKVRAILEGAGYLETAGGAPGTFVLKIDDVDGVATGSSGWRVGGDLSGGPDPIERECRSEVAPGMLDATTRPTWTIG